MSHSKYLDDYEQLKDLSAQLITGIPETMSGFGELHKAAVAPGELDARTKELIALAISIAMHCNGCIAYHVHDAVKAGATREEILETIGVVILMGGSPSMIYGCEALEALDEFERERITT